MTTERKRAANARNALRSTGPRTTAGKARTARNAITHGLLSREVLLRGDDRKEFEALAEGFRRDRQPRGTYEEILVDIMIVTVWRLHRIRRMEVDILSWKPSRTPIGKGIIIYDPAVPEVRNQFVLPDNGRGPTREPIDADQGSVEAEEDALSPGLAFLQGCGGGADAFSKLSRYETALEKALYRAAHELERCQRARAGGYVPAPLAVDVSVSGVDEGRPGGRRVRRQSRLGAPGSAAGENGQTGRIGQTHMDTLAQAARAIEDELFDRDTGESPSVAPSS